MNFTSIKIFFNTDTFELKRKGKQDYIRTAKKQQEIMNKISLYPQLKKAGAATVWMVVTENWNVKKVTNQSTVFYSLINAFN